MVRFSCSRFLQSVQARQWAQAMAHGLLSSSSFARCHFRCRPRTLGWSGWWTDVNFCYCYKRVHFWDTSTSQMSSRLAGFLWPSLKKKSQGCVLLHYVVHDRHKNFGCTCTASVIIKWSRGIRGLQRLGKSPKDKNQFTDKNYFAKWHHQN